MNTNANGLKFERVDGKDDLANKPLLIMKPGKNLNAGDITTGVFKKVTISEQYGSKGYIIATDDNDVLFNGCGSLNKQMENVVEGELVQIEYRGQAAIKTGKFAGKMSHLYTVRRATSADVAEEGA